MLNNKIKMLKTVIGRIGIVVLYTIKLIYRLIFNNLMKVNRGNPLYLL